MRRRPARRRSLVDGPGERTIVAVHAHPDDEALLTGGSLAWASAHGHRVIVAVATLGEAGLTEPGQSSDLGDRRWRELEESAAALGVHRLVNLGYADSGLDQASAAAGLQPFATADVEDAAVKLAALLVEEGADVVIGYDAAGGYGHPDHRQVHLVTRRAAELAGTPTVLEATVDRNLIAPVLSVLGWLAHVVPMPQLPRSREVFTPSDSITHTINVGPQLGAKRAALRAHASQQGGGPRTISLLLALPRPVGNAVLGREWFHQVR